MDSKLLTKSTISSLASFAALRSDDNSDSAKTDQPTLNPHAKYQDEPIRPFVYRRATDKTSTPGPSQPKRRRSDTEGRGN